MTGKLFSGKVASRFYRYPVGQKFFIEIGLSHTVYEINEFLRFIQKFKMAGKTILGKNASTLCRNPGGQKCCRNHSRSLSFREKRILRFMYKFKMAAQRNSISLSFRDKHVFLHFTQKFKMKTKNGGRTIFGKVASRICRYPVGQKFHRNRSI